MFTQEEKRFFASVAKNAASVSSCPIKQGAVYVLGRSLVASGHNRLVVKDKAWEISAIQNAIIDGFGSASFRRTLSGSLFSTYFPTIDDLKLIISAEIDRVYFFGEINNQESVEMLNTLPESGIELEMIQLE